MSTPTDFRNFPPLRGLADAQLSELAATASEEHYRDGERIFTEGRPARGCRLVRSGQVVLDTHVPGRGRMTVDTLHAGDVLGWSWMVPPHRWHFTATALGDTHAILLDTDRLMSFAEDDPVLGYAMAKVVVAVLLDRLQSTRVRMLDLYGVPDA